MGSPLRPVDLSALKKRRILVVFNLDFSPKLDALDPADAARRDIGTVVQPLTRALRSLGARVDVHPLDGDVTDFRRALRAQRTELVFNLCESIARDARLETVVPALLEEMSIPFTGSGAETLSLCLHKDRVKQSLRRAGVRVPRGALASARAHSRAWPLPAIVKPSREDGSAGIDWSSVVRSKAALARAVSRIVQDFSQPAMVEEFIDGREFNVALLGSPQLRVLPLHEIDFSALPRECPRILSYEAKWKPGSTADLGTRPVPAHVDKTLAGRLAKAALAAARAVGLRGYGRVDLRVDAKGRPFVIDVNPNCDLSLDAGFARAARAGGWNYTNLVGLLALLPLHSKRHHGSSP